MSISKVVDGLEFVLPVDSAVGAEQARITLTELSKKLGYSEKARLKDLAIRHASELSEFGDATTVVVSVKCGLFDKLIEEPTYNVEQAAYLALSSETPVGRASRVAIIRAHRALMDAYRQPAITMTQAELIAASANLLVSIERSQAEHERRLAEQANEIVAIKSTIESDKRESALALEAVAALPPAPIDVSERSYGQMAVALVNSWASGHSKDFKGTWNKFYQAVEERPETRIDLKTRSQNAKAKKQNVRVSDIIDASGKSAEIYAIARQLFAKTVAA